VSWVGGGWMWKAEVNVNSAINKYFGGVPK